MGHQQAGLSSRTAALAVAIALGAAAPARASGDELAGFINAYRAAPGSCDGQPTGPVAPLAPHPALARVRIAHGILLQHALERAGYPSEHAEAIYVSGPPDAKSVMAAIRQKYCRTLLSTQFSAVGTVRVGDEWTVVLAQPLPPVILPDMEQAGKTILDAVNAARATPRWCGDQRYTAAPALTWNAALGDAALVHSRDMATYRYFSHQGKDGRAVADRASQAGYRWQRIGENIASGMNSAEAALAGWLDSPGHCANIMYPGFTEMGAAYAVNPAASVTGTLYWTQVFGTPR